MINVVKHIVVCILACFIFYGGAGVNMISYCCGECRTAGVESVLVDKCCEIHHHDKDSHGHPAGSGHIGCNDMDDISDCCQLERISFEWDNSTHQIQKPEPVVLEIPDFNLFSAILFTLSDEEEYLSMEGYSPPPGLCPRVYLSLLTTLLI